ncbi:MAG: AsmA family protein [Phycisphaeraceae bacterium]|nr:AsmA family protein [Phycisphaeraceae bacterium]
MIKLIKRLVIFVVAVLLLIAVGVGVLFFYIDNIAKTGIEKGGQYALGVPTELESINISIFSGKCDLNNLRIANPAGFEFAHFMKINKGEFALDTTTLRSDVIAIDKLHFTGVELSIEKIKSGANYQVILDNLQKTMASDSQTDKPSEDTSGGDSGGGKGFVIRDILIEDISVNINMDALGLGAAVKKTIRLKEPIHLTNVGSAEDAGAQMSTVIAQLVQTMLAEIIRQGGGLIPADIAGELGKGLESIKGLSDLGTQIIGDTVGGTVKEVGKVTKEVTQAAGDATKQVGKAADDLLKGVGGLFGGKKEEAPK